MPNEPDASANPAKKQRRPRRWRRRLAWMTVLFFLLVAAFVTLAWQQRVTLVNRALASLVAPLEASVGGVEGDFLAGRFSVRDFVLRAPGKDGVIVMEVPRLELEGSPGELAAGRVRSVIAENPQVVVDDRLMDFLSGDSGSGGGFAVDRIAITNARVRVEAAGLPRGEVTFDYEGGKIVAGGDALPSASGQKMVFTRLALSQGDSTVNLDGARVEFDLDGDARMLRVRKLSLPPGSAVITPAIFALGGKGGEKSAPPVVYFDEVDIAAQQIAVSGLPGMPDFSLNASWAGRGIRVGETTATEVQAIELRDVSVRNQGDAGAPVASAAKIAVKIHAEESGLVVVDRLDADDVTVALVPAALDWLMPEKATQSAALRPPMLIAGAVIRGARLSGTGFAGDKRLSTAVPDFQTTLDLELKNLALKPDGGIASAEAQHVSLQAVEVRFPDEEPFARVTRLALAVVPDDFSARRELASLSIEEPAIQVSRELLAKYAAPADAAGEGAFFAEGLMAKMLTVARAKVSLRGVGSGIPDGDAAFDVITEGAEPAYVLRASATLATPGNASAPFATVREITARISPANAWKSSLIDSLLVKGASLSVGSDLQSLGNARAAKPAEVDRAAPGPNARPPWRIGRVEIEDSKVNISDMIPLMDPTTFDLAIEPIDDLVLTEEGLLEHTKSQRAEIAKVRLNSAYGGPGSLPVATFDTLFLYYSLAGLMRNRLDRVEIVSPTINVGEQLFWYIDFFRKQFAAPPAEARAAASAPLIASTNRSDALAARAAVRPTAVGPEPGWSVGKIDAYYGKLKLAFKGSTIDALPALPFSCSAPLDDGRVDLTLEMSRGTYRPSTQLPLEIDIEEGTALFNLPTKDRSNNLVQTFRASEVRYGKGQPFKARNVFVSVTYDQFGVYGTFGGELYGGYVKGGFDVYLDDNVSWDFWVSGDGIESKPMTRVLTPEYITMSGRTNFQIVASGDMESLYTATGSLRTTTPGSLTITGLDPILADLPGEWTKLKTSLTTAGLTSFRDFPFEKCAGEFTLYGREGDLKFELGGPRGNRNFSIRIHDHRTQSPQ